MLRCFRLGNPDLELKIRIFGFPVQHKLQKLISRRVSSIEILTRHGFQLAKPRQNPFSDLVFDWKPEIQILRSKSGQEPMTRSLQLYCVRVTAFSQIDLFLV